jgi:hypothetical protein
MLWKRRGGSKFPDGYSCPADSHGLGHVKPLLQKDAPYCHLKGKMVPPNAIWQLTSTHHSTNSVVCHLESLFGFWFDGESEQQWVEN